MLFFDEVDALGASRSDMRHSAGRHLVNQFLSELDGVEANNDGVQILAATNVAQAGHDHLCGGSNYGLLPFSAMRHLV